MKNLQLLRHHLKSIRNQEGRKTANERKIKRIETSIVRTKTKVLAQILSKSKKDI